MYWKAASFRILRWRKNYLYNKLFLLKKTLSNTGFFIKI
ncbi:hypothetical protein B4135_3050 [Caldibacillus debilis]|uniref:Uncharacterized protein n=1 Tax=Caldibacillus debilis TaxID=301148 RepID=A0A150LKM2_9BACI|nr:hypothetical protein B4135_3050 [Caldibacillus debilis]